MTVINTTGAGGLGGKAARIAENAGIRVVMLANSESPVATCQVEGSEQAVASVGAGVLRRTFGCETVVDRDVADGELRWVLGLGFRDQWLGEVSE